MLTALTIAGAVGIGALLLIGLEIRRRNIHRWLGSYLRQARTGRFNRPRGQRGVHVLLCIADHFEPNHGKPGPAIVRSRVAAWVEKYPKLFASFRDSDGRPPQHTFFYPLEEYDPAHLDALADLCRRGWGEVEVHLHHDHDTADALRDKLLAHKRILADRHGLLSRDRKTGKLAYGFIHGNWALDNSRPDGRWCGVNNELDILRQTGCYADFTLPSAPSPTQTRQINSIYYAIDDPLRPKSHDRGVEAGSGPRPDQALLLIQGPLMLDGRKRKWGVLPRVENACLQANQPPTPGRLDLWLKAGIGIPSRPDWVFIKLHTHGADEENAGMLLGEPMTSFHEALAQRAAADSLFHYHYVTTRQMYNLARAAEGGWTDSVAAALDFELEFNGARPSR
jgi:hypothetical protein